jgi:hypothetical protein
MLKDRTVVVLERADDDGGNVGGRDRGAAFGDGSEDVPLQLARSSAHRPVSVPWPTGDAALTAPVIPGCVMPPRPLWRVG